MKVTPADVLVVLGAASLIVGLFMVDTIVGLVGGGLVLMGAGLLLARLGVRSS